VTPKERPNIPAFTKPSQKEIDKKKGRKLKNMKQSCSRVLNKYRSTLSWAPFTNAPLLPTMISSAPAHD
jgi:hypothetical protein